jgi:type IV pilus assembly protein PilY1
MYTHSWIDKSVVLDPESSYVNVITHHIAFGAKHPLLQDAAGESGGEYITAYNKGQLVAAFYSFVLSMSEAVSFIAPVVSVDAANKIQSGDDLYTGLFFPKNSRYWIGNLKKFRFGDGSSARPDMWMIYDGADKPAIDSSGAFLDNTAAIWADDNDVNDSDSYGAADVQEDGAGEVLTERVAADFLGANYYERSIYTCKSGNLTNFTRNNITPSDLGINSGDTTADNTTRDKIVNFIYGYTYDADATTGDPVGAREWALGSIIHSRPVVIDYYDPNDLTTLQKRYIAVGANDGMLHIFDDTDGQEAFAFVPEDLLGKLQDIPANDFFDSVDGHITLYRRNEQPKYLIFGERRGGLKYWCLDISDNNPANWTVAWDYSNPEIRQSWSEAKVAKIQIGAKNFKDVLIFTGGYHEEEDNYPEPFDDEDNSGSPFSSSGSIDPKEWKSSNSDQDVNGNGQYDKYNPDQNEYGRGVFVVDIDSPFAGLQDILPFSVTYGATNVTAGLVQTLADMKYCFPASPSIVTSTLRYTDDCVIRMQTVICNRQQISCRRFMRLIFMETYTRLPMITVPGARHGRRERSFLPIRAAQAPAAQWEGATIPAIRDVNPFIPLPYHGAVQVYFLMLETIVLEIKIASLFVGTGDGEHPQYSIIRNCFYAIYDDSSLTAETARLDSNGDPVTDTNGGYVYDPVDVSSYPYTEDDLLNLTCDELGADTTIDANAGFTKDDLLALLRDDPIYDADTTGNNPDWRLEAGSAHEGDAKGWYIILEDQGDVSACSHCTYDATIDASDESAVDNHSGEKVLSQPSLYYRTIYFTTYQPAFDDPCKSQGNGFNYALNYEMGSASLNLNGGNSSSQDITDRYRKHTNIYGIPSGFEIVTRNGHAAALASMGGAIIGGGEGGGFEIPSPGLGLELFYWLEGNSEK